MMNRVRIRDLALVAVASGLLAFEVTGLRGALPAAMQAICEQGEQGVPRDAMDASRGAARTTAAVLRGLGSATTHAAIGAVKGAARMLGTVTPSVQAGTVFLLTSRDQTHVMSQRVRVITMNGETCREVVAAGLSARRVRQICRELETARRRSTL